MPTDGLLVPTVPALITDQGDARGLCPRTRTRSIEALSAVLSCPARPLPRVHPAIPPPTDNDRRKTGKIIEPAPAA